MRMLAIGIFVFVLLAPWQVLRKRAWRREHANEPVSRELRYGRYVFAGLALMIAISSLAGG
jgi:hypothetical protein